MKLLENIPINMRMLKIATNALKIASKTLKIASQTLAQNYSKAYKFAVKLPKNHSIGLKNRETVPWKRSRLTQKAQKVFKNTQNCSKTHRTAI